METKENPGINIAKGKICAFDPAPNDRACVDPGDSRKLTDGTISAQLETFWRDKKTVVGWREALPVIITLDLKKTEPIGEVSFHTAFEGPKGIMWPQSIEVFVSENNRDFFLVGNLINPEWPGKLPKEIAPFGEKKRPATYRYAAKINSCGRYICLSIRSPRHVYCDEIEVYRGPEVLLEKKPDGRKITNIKSYVRNEVTREKAAYQLKADMKGARQNAALLPSAERTAIEKELSLLSQKIDGLKTWQPEPGFRAIIPLNPLHEEILRCNARILELRKFPPLFAWHKNRWAPLAVTEAPETQTEPPGLSIAMMDNECRAETINLTNTTPESMEVSVSFTGLPSEAAINVRQVEFLATAQGRAIADPLCPAMKTAAGFLVSIPSGMTRQLWIDFKPQGSKAGTYQGTMVFSPKKLPQLAVPLSLHIYPFKFPDQPSLSLAMFDYTCQPPGFTSITKKNAPLAIKDMREHFVDTPYGQRGSACWPEKGDFDTEGNLVKPLRTKDFDDWMSSWQGIRRCHIYLTNALDDFCGEPMGTPKFTRMVSQWAAAFAAHARERGLQPKQIALHLFDEPSPENPRTYTINTLWGKAIKAGAPDLLLFTDTSGFEESSEALKEMIAVHDIICPQLPIYGGITEKIRDIVGSEKNKQFWFYSCDGPAARHFDPYYYHRLQAWHCWRNGATGMAFWNYWNYYNDETCTAWNELETQGRSFGVVYSTADSITAGKHWEAIREGVEDHEYLRMLHDRIMKLKENGASSAALSKAGELLKKLPSEVTGTYDRKMMSWHADKDRSAADTARTQILDALETLAQ
ncbi:MAG: hypothetical protein PHV34_23080 [Verrucomicrobiae bacterium]|nr:hypothetical protein [Verrucomicrobiae bacterium]